MPYIEEDKANGIKEEYIPDWIQDIKTDPVIVEDIPWLNVPQLNQAISVET